MYVYVALLRCECFVCGWVRVCAFVCAVEYTMLKVWVRVWVCLSVADLYAWDS